MTVLKIIVTVLLVVDCIGLIIAILKQQSKNEGLGLLGGGNDTFWSQNKGRSMEGRIVALTAIMAALFVVLTIVLNLSALN